MSGMSMRAALGYEWARTRTVRSTWWLFGCSLVASALTAWGYAGVLTGMISGGLPVNGREAAVFVVSKASTAPIAAGVLGIFAVGPEYRYATMTTTLLVTPRRTVAFAAKAVVVGCFSMALAVASAAAAWLVAIGMLGGKLRFSLGLGDLVQLHGALLLLVVGWGLVGLGVATVVRSQLLSLGAILAVPFVVEPGIRGVGMVTGQPWLLKAAGYLPFAAGSAMADVTRGVSGTVLAAGSAHVAPALAACVFLLTVTALGAAAVVNFRRQDIG